MTLYRIVQFDRESLQIMPPKSGDVNPNLELVLQPAALESFKHDKVRASAELFRFAFGEDYHQKLMQVL